MKCHMIIKWVSMILTLLNQIWYLLALGVVLFLTQSWIFGVSNFLLIASKHTSKICLLQWWSIPSFLHLFYILERIQHHKALVPTAISEEYVIDLIPYDLNQEVVTDSWSLKWIFLLLVYQTHTMIWELFETLSILAKKSLFYQLPCHTLERMENLEYLMEE